MSFSGNGPKCPERFAESTASSHFALRAFWPAAAYSDRHRSQLDSRKICTPLLLQLNAGDIPHSHSACSTFLYG